MYADIGTFEPLGNKDSATALYKYDEKNLVTSKGQSGSGFLMLEQENN